jgi:NAD(P)-dependent dehydrogenase (short-subunit alcohol dehydrogenase family)
MARLNGLAAIVLGGDSGCAEGLAERLAAEGANVLRIDDAAADSVAQSVDEAVETLGRLDLLVCAHDAPPPTATPSDEAAEDHVYSAVWQEHFELPRAAMRAALPHLRAQDGGGQVVALVSQYGDSVWRGIGAYQAASEALKAHIRSAAEEWGRFNVRVNALLPAADTIGYRQLRSRHPDAADRLARALPLGRLGSPQRDIGGALMLLASESGRYLTGHMIHVDGGQHLAPSPYEALIA